MISHLARNADALLNLLTWARTGVEHPMYASRADRDADIAHGAGRAFLLLVEDLIAACERLDRAARQLPDTGWATILTNARGERMRAAEVPWLRAREAWIHLVDLNAGIGFDALPADALQHLLDDVVGQFDGRPDVPQLALRATFTDGSQRNWLVNSSSDGSTVSGSAAELLEWLTGRGDGSGLAGRRPTLPAMG